MSSVAGGGHRNLVGELILSLNFSLFLLFQFVLPGN